jgi:hypothetical protein
VIALSMGVLSAVLVLAGGVVFFVVGRARGALAGVGFVVLAVGTVLGSLLSTFAPTIIRDGHLSIRAYSTMFSTVQLLFHLVGWGLVIAAVIVLARSGPAPATLGATVGPPPGPPYGQVPPGYGPPWGSGHGEPSSGPQGPPPPSW